MPTISVAMLFMAGLLTGCRQTTLPQIEAPAGDVAGELSRSPDGRCGAYSLSSRDGHSPMTTTRVAVVRAGVSEYREIRLPAPNERFSTTFEGWEAPGVMKIRGLTLDGDVIARYSCLTQLVEVVK